MQLISTRIHAFVSQSEQLSLWAQAGRSLTVGGQISKLAGKSVQQELGEGLRRQMGWSEETALTSSIVSQLLVL